MSAAALLRPVVARYARRAPPVFRLVCDAEARPTPGLIMNRDEPRAPTALDVARWAGLTFVDGSPIPGEAPPPPHVDAGLALLDTVAEVGRWRDPGDLGLAVAPSAAWAFGLDQPTPRMRLRAAVARAAWDHARRQANLDDERSATDEAAEAADAIEAALAALDGGDWRRGGDLFDFAGKRTPTRLVAGIAALRRLRVDPPERFAAMAEDAGSAATVLRELMWTLHEAAAARRQEGRPPEAARLFLFVRLAEIYAGLAGKRPSFHAKALTDDARRAPLPLWLDFLLGATMVSLNRKLTPNEINGTLRKINGAPPGTNAEGGDERPDGMAVQRLTVRRLAAESFIAGRPRGRFEYWDLGSVGLFDLHFNDFRDLPPF